MSNALALLPADLFGFLLVFSRVGAALMVMPAFGESYVPARVRLALALGITLAVLPSLPARPPLPEQPAELALLIGGESLVGAAIGLQGPAVGRGWWDLTFRSEIPYYYLFLAVLGLLLLIVWQVERSRFGYYLRAIKSGERAARSLGVKVRRYKLYALLLSACFTALAGSLYALMVGFVDPESGFGILVSVDMIIVAALGGAGTLFGPLLGAVILVPLREFTNSAFGGGGSGLT